MKTHDLSKALNHLSRVLRAGPNIELDDLANLSTHVEQSRTSKVSKDLSDKGSALALLAQIASYNKRELSELIIFLGIPVEVKNTDSVRDLLGRTLRYIQDNPTVQTRLASSGGDKVSESAPPLARALAILMSQS